jgi:hypothetical protein
MFEAPEDVRRWLAEMVRPEKTEKLAQPKKEKA